MKKYDVVVIGSGVGGYSAAFTLARDGLKVAVVEKHHIGGECVNYGCVPSKVFYNLAEALRTIEQYNGTYNVEWSSLVDRTRRTVEEMRNGLQYLFEGYGVDIYTGKGRIKSNNVVVGGEVIEAGKIIVATGTDPKPLPIRGFDGDKVINNRHIYFLEEKPDKVLIVGGGVIGVETAYYLSKLGVESIIVEAQKHILPFMDIDVAATIRRFLRENNVEIYEKCLVEKIEDEGKGLTVKTTCNDEEIVVDKVFVAIGRTPNTRDLGLEENHVELDKWGFIKVREGYETTNPNILAVGDATGGVLLAHKAIVEGILAANNIVKGVKEALNNLLIPRVYFTGLEVASIGYTEKELRDKGIKYAKKRIPLSVLAAVRIRTDKLGYVKILHDADNIEKIYGIQVVAPHASEIIGLYLPMYTGRIKTGEYAKTPIPHLTVAESIREVAEYLIGEPVHFLLKK